MKYYSNDCKFRNSETIIVNAVEDYLNNKTLYKIGSTYNLYDYMYKEKCSEYNYLRRIKKYKPKIDYFNSPINKKDIKYIYEYKNIIYDSNKNDLENKIRIIEEFLKDIINLNKLYNNFKEIKK
jgi:hypothetical protein